MRSLIATLSATIFFSFCIASIKCDNVKIKKEITNDSLKEITNGSFKFNDNDYPIKCKLYHVFQGENLMKLGKKFRASPLNLTRLNPDLNIFSAEVGTPLCVVGTISKVAMKFEAKGTKRNIGKRPKNLVRYKTTPAVDNCDRILQNSNPPLSQMKFVELNPQKSCENMKTKSLMIFLPKGTVVNDDDDVKIKAAKKGSNDDVDCLMGPWSDWSSCENGERTRIRNVYQEASGNGKACSSSSEMISCESSNFMSRSSDQCFHAADGCSNPLGNYRIFTPACNFHDICWACRDQQWPSYMSVQTCDDIFAGLQIITCDNYWRNWFDKAWCHFVASIQFVGVQFVKPTYDYPGTCPPLDKVLNAKLGKAHIGYAVPAGCDCEGNSCSYRGEPFPCWGDGSICGAGTTCNNCCNGYNYWGSKWFTACGNEPCWGRGTLCGAGTTCGNCCSGADCPWYQFGVCTCQ